MYIKKELSSTGADAAAKHKYCVADSDVTVNGKLHRKGTLRLLGVNGLTVTLQQGGYASGHFPQADFTGIPGLCDKLSPPKAGNVAGDKK